MAKRARVQFDSTDPMFRNFMCENYEKELNLRVRWNTLHKELINKAVKLTHEPSNYTPADVFRARMIAGLTNATMEYISSARNRIIKPFKDYLSDKDRSAEPGEPTMKPIEKKVKDIIKESKAEYLKARNKKSPEDKFNFIETTNWKYGWELRKSSLKLRGPAHGRTSHLIQSIKGQHSGPHRDPDHYKSADRYQHICLK